jgi:hypothetical protein
MLFEDFLVSDDYVDLMEYVRSSRNNKLMHSSSEFDIVYDYYLNLVKTTEETRDYMYEKYIEYEKERPVIVNYGSSNLLSVVSSDDENSGVSSDVNDNDECKTDNTDNTDVVEDIYGTHGAYDDVVTNSNKKKYCITSVLHPDYPYNSVPFVSFMKDYNVSADNTHEDEDDYIINDVNLQEETSEESEFENLD